MLRSRIPAALQLNSWTLEIKILNPTQPYIRCKIKFKKQTCLITRSYKSSSPAKFFKQLKAANDVGAGPRGGLAKASPAAEHIAQKNPSCHLLSSQRQRLPTLENLNSVLERSYKQQQLHIDG